MTFWASQSKNQAYVTNVVSWYRRQLDHVLAARGQSRSSSGRSSIEFEPDLTKTFNRGFTTYFVEGRGEPPGAIDSPKMVGEYIGTVVAVQGGSFVVDTHASLHSGDGLCWFDAHHKLRGTIVNAARPTKHSPHGTTVTPRKLAGIHKGLRVYRNHDHAFLRQVERSRPVRKIAVHLCLECTPEGLVLHARDQDGNTARAALVMEKVPAVKPERAEATARQQLGKTGNTPFAYAEVDLAWEQPYFVPVAALNGLRRETLERLQAERRANHPLMRGEIQRNQAPYPETTLTYRGNALNQRAVAFYRRHGVREIAPAAESGLDMRGKVVMRTRYCIKHQLDWCDGTRPGAGPGEPLYLVDQDEHRYRLRFACADCEMEVISE
jgi:putative protease